MKGSSLSTLDVKKYLLINKSKKIKDILVSYFLFSLFFISYFIIVQNNFTEKDAKKKKKEEKEKLKKKEEKKLEKERKRIAYEAKLADLEKEREEEKQGNKIQNGNGNLIFIFLSFCPSHIMSKSASKLKKYLDLPYKKISCWQLTITKLKKFTF